MRHARCVLDGIMLREEPAEAAAADDHPPVLAGKVLSYSLDIVDDLIERIRFGARALAVAAIVKGQDANLVAQLAVDLEVRVVVAWVRLLRC